MILFPRTPISPVSAPTAGQVRKAVVKVLL